MKKALIIIILILMFLPSKTANLPDLSVEDLEAYGIAGAMSMVSMASPVVPPVPVPVPVEKCRCINGKVSYDGGTSLSDCPCKTSDQNCGCKKAKEIAEVKKDLFPRTVLITHPFKNGKPNCDPCISVEKDVVARLRNDEHKAAGWDVGEEAFNDFQILDLEDPDTQAEIDRLGLTFSSIPTFFFLTETSKRKVVGAMSYNLYIDLSKKK